MTTAATLFFKEVALVTLGKESTALRCVALGDGLNGPMMLCRKTMAIVFNECLLMVAQQTREPAHAWLH